jgi:hypothetical protein
VSEIGCVSRGSCHTCQNSSLCVLATCIACPVCLYQLRFGSCPCQNPSCLGLVVVSTRPPPRPLRLHLAEVGGEHGGGAVFSTMVEGWAGVIPTCHPTVVTALFASALTLYLLSYCRSYPMPHLFSSHPPAQGDPHCDILAVPFFGDVCSSAFEAWSETRVRSFDCLQS